MKTFFPIYVPSFENLVQKTNVHDNSGLQLVTRVHEATPVEYVYDFQVKDEAKVRNRGSPCELQDCVDDCFGCYSCERACCLAHSCRVLVETHFERRRVCIKCVEDLRLQGVRQTHANEFLSQSETSGTVMAGACRVMPASDVLVIIKNGSTIVHEENISVHKLNVKQCMRITRTGKWIDNLDD
jgi:hypothetical protein